MAHSKYSLSELYIEQWLNVSGESVFEATSYKAIYKVILFNNSEKYKVAAKQIGKNKE